MYMRWQARTRFRASTVPGMGAFGTLYHSREGPTSCGVLAFSQSLPRDQVSLATHPSLLGPLRTTVLSLPCAAAWGQSPSSSCQRADCDSRSTRCLNPYRCHRAVSGAGGPPVAPSGLARVFRPDIPGPFLHDETVIRPSSCHAQEIELLDEGAQTKRWLFPGRAHRPERKASSRPWWTGSREEARGLSTGQRGSAPSTDRVAPCDLLWCFGQGPGAETQTRSESVGRPRGCRIRASQTFYHLALVPSPASSAPVMFLQTLPRFSHRGLRTHCFLCLEGPTPCLFLGNPTHSFRRT